MLFKFHRSNNLMKIMFGLQICDQLKCPHFNGWEKSNKVEEKSEL